MISFKRLGFRAVLLGLLLSSVCSIPSFAADFGSLISPGDLFAAHTEYEGLNNCTKCHTKGEGLPNSKCTSIGCHATIGAVQLVKKGLHGSVADKPCVECHKDHKGRSYNGTDWDPAKFDHAKTGYKLEAKHAPVKCEKCHTTKTLKGAPSYMGLGTECKSCHTKDDIHKGTLKDKCETCHNTGGWKGKFVTFDHDKTYKLDGKHEKVKCEKCHTVKGLYAVENKEQCVTCHKKDDKHKGSLGNECQKCHKTSNWKEILFDHSKTKYPLLGKHIPVKCELCHLDKTKASFKVENFASCDATGCHDKGKFGNVHGNQFKGQKCDQCHNLEGFKPSLFKHEDPIYKGYRLEGKHAKVKCELCHIADPVTKVSLYKPMSTATCDSAGCHDKGKFGNVHEKQFQGQKCDQCHNLDGFKPSLFKHEDPAYKGYKLNGKHAKVKCELCHRPHPATKVSLYKPINSSACANSGCHDVKERGAIHGPQFKGQPCEQCHKEDGWKPATFDHNAPVYKGYRLEGKHAESKCEKCHRTDPLTNTVHYKPINSSACANAGCHDVKERGAIHGPQFKDQKCDQCHNLKGWKPSVFDHNAPAYKGYRLEGKHAEAKCEKCHKPAADGAVVYRPIEASGCLSSQCHRDPHAGQFKDQKCDKCHTPKGWTGKDLNFNHQTSSRYPLEGKHLSTPCEKCHLWKIWRPIESECVKCHDKDDKKAHQGKMGSKCEECHTAANWEPKTFFHEVTGFPLRGAHTQIVCKDCHKSKGIYTGLGPECAKCHTDPHFNQFGAISCDRCHTAKNWFPERFRHSETGFRLEGTHRAAACETCHTGRSYRNVSPDCFQCHTHRGADPVNGYYGTNAAGKHNGNTNCVECHLKGAFTWKGANFTHATMTFTGAHSAIKTTCSKCHATGSTATYWAGATMESQCYTCHKDTTGGMPASLSYSWQASPARHTTCPTDCQLCHTTSTWLLPTYSGPACN